MSAASPDPQESSESLPTNPSASEPEQSAPIEALFPVVGIAASAGGLEAFTELIGHLPADTGMAFVLIQHLSPDHESLLPEILGGLTMMPVYQVQDQMQVVPNTVYVIPPNTQMTLVEGVLRLSERQKSKGQYLPANVFFESLAAERGNRAIGVVLSGMDGDGAQGIKAIKVAGGVTFAQCEATARFDSMPNTAVATGSVDFVLPPQTIAAELVHLSQSSFLTQSEPLRLQEEPPSKPGEPLVQILALLRGMTGVDFTQYKPTTLNRRIQRRMMLYKLESLEEYARYLQGHSNEIQALYDEILIHVTSFFRDPQVFEQLKVQVFPTISQNKSGEVPIRIWVAGCSTGEEVYSIAISLLEYFSDRPTIPPIQIFATDISEAAISKARSGFYLESQMEGISPDRKNRFFVPQAGGGYQISSVIRELCVFARHNLGGDPPFSNLDLISCRNVLIYLSEPLQERIMALFHYSLNLTGFLLLGTSESVKTASDLFATVDEICKIYSRKLTLSRSLFSFTTSALPLTNTQSQPHPPLAIPLDLAREVDLLISNRYAPVSVVVDEQMQILQMRGDLDPYLKLPPGTTELNLLAMARAGLEVPLRTALYHAQTQNLPMRQEQVQLEAGGEPLLLNLEVLPFRPALTNALYFLVFFNSISPSAAASDPERLDSLEPVDLEREVVSLRQALAAATQRELSAQAHLQAVIQEQTQLNQNLRVANEEILSSNEELQSTNEELQTAKEEIQATNEELSTTNDELFSRNLQQSRDNSDLNNFIASISIPIVMLTNDLRIRRFTPTAQRLFNFIPTDVGRPFTDLHGNIDVSELEPMILEVLETLNTKEQEIQTESGYWYSLRIRPYRTTENQIDGVTLVFFDIDPLKRHTARIEAARHYAETIIETVQIPLVVLDADLRVNTANRSFYEIFQVAEVDTISMPLLELSHGQWDSPQLRSLLAIILDDDTPVQNFEVDYQFEHLGPKTLLFNAGKLQREDNLDMILLSIADVTERKQFETERSQLFAREQTARQQAEAANRAKDEFLSNLSHELRNPLTSLLGWVKLLRTGSLDEVTSQRALESIEQSAQVQKQLIEDILDVSRITNGKLRLDSRPMDLQLVVQAALENIHLLALTKNIELVSSLSSIMVLGDGERLQQVMWNLLSNAIKFTPAGGQVEVTLGVVENQAQIQVCDTGKGIAADLLPHIFERFYQVDASTTKADRGLGLGLAIVQHLVSLHGGTVQADSPGSGQGTTLTVRLPLYLPPTPSPPTSLPAPVSSAAPSQDSPITLPSLAGLSILMVDDQIEMVNLLQFVFSRCGADVVAVTRVRDAIAALNDHPERYNLIISDIGMPEEDGYFLIQQIRSRSAADGGRIPAIALTGYTSTEEQQRAIEAGFQRCLAKPFDVLQLGFIIIELVRETRRDDSTG